MRYFPHTEDDIRHMLEAVGVPATDALFADIPAQARVLAPLKLPGALSEPELLAALEALAARNASPTGTRSFLGAGAYDRYTPAAVDMMLKRGEFYTAYTPYQPEISQGTLQAVFEYQSMVCALLGTDISNASMYDGASALAEALWMVRRISRQRRIVVAGAVHPQWMKVVRTYAEPFLKDVVEVPEDPATGLVDLEAVRAAWDDDTAALVVQHPNFLGGVEDLEAMAGFVRKSRGLLVVAFSDAVAFGLLKPPGLYGADIVVGEGQSLGLPLSYGGPYLGLFTVAGQHVRAMPGRLVGQTVDNRGDTAYVLTLATREQHIRRERATSNICTNQGLCALASAIYLALMGPQGLKRVATASHLLANRAKGLLASVPGVSVPYSAKTFAEFVVDLPVDASTIVEKGVDAGIVPGLDLGRYREEWRRRLLVSVTERRSLADLDALAAFLTSALS